MANSPVDRIPHIMEENCGTRVLITDREADKYIERAARHGQDRYSRWCGGKGGFDDYAERLH